MVVMVPPAVWASAAVAAAIMAPDGDPRHEERFHGSQRKS